MKDFLQIITEKHSTGAGEHKRHYIVVKPVYRISGTNIMRKGGSFYAFLQDDGFWSKDQLELFKFIDKTIYSYREEHYKKD